MQRAQRESQRARTEATLELTEAALLATGLAAFKGDARRAALSVGLDVDRRRLKRLEKLARSAFPELAGGGNVATASLVARAIAVLTVRTLDQAHLIAPRDLPVAARNLVAVRDGLLGEGAPKHPFTSFAITIKGHDGQVTEVEPNTPATTIQ